jgi:hypothetical protein
MTLPSDPADTLNCFGDCLDCGRQHGLPEGNARALAHSLMREFEKIRRLDHLVPAASADPLLSFDYLFPGEPSNMFGVLECRDKRGGTVVLRAFSSLRAGIREVDGWVPPLLSAETYYEMIVPEQARIKGLTREMERLDPQSSEHEGIEKERKRISRALFAEIQNRYVLHNFRGVSRPMRDAYSRKGGIPGGVGECCAPKLLNHAARTGLRPVGLAEFYWGGAKNSGSRRPGEFYPCCEARCQPLLGFMLCGLDDGA